MNKKNRALIAVCLIILGFVAIVWAIIAQTKKSFESFNGSGTCPVGTTWFVDGTGNAGCCKGTINPLTRKCSGTLACSFATMADLPSGVESCSAIIKREHDKTVANICPPSLPYIIGTIDAPKGCCGVATSGDDTCPVVAPQCSMFKNGGGGLATPIPMSPWWNGPAGKDEKLGCVEQRFYETLSCPVDHILTSPTWMSEFSQNGSMCINSKNMHTCYPKELVKSLVAAGKVRAVDAAKVQCP